MKKKVIGYRVKEEYLEAYKKLFVMKEWCSFNYNSYLHDKCQELGIMHWLEEVYEEFMYEANTWYKTGLALIFNIDEGDNLRGYGFWNNEWSSEIKYHLSHLLEPRKATEEEIFMALANEADKRGYKEGNYKCLYLPDETEKHKEGYYYDVCYNKLWTGFEVEVISNKIFDNGTWAEIIEPKLELPVINGVEGELKKMYGKEFERIYYLQYGDTKLLVDWFKEIDGVGVQRIKSNKCKSFFITSKETTQIRNYLKQEKLI